jgi:hypothetical protein
MLVILAEIADQYDAVLYVSTSDVGTYTDPKYPKYVEFVIGVWLNVFGLLRLATTSPDKTTVCNARQSSNAFPCSLVHIGILILDNVRFEPKVPDIIVDTLGILTTPNF